MQSSVNGKTNLIVIGNEPGWSKVEKIRSQREAGKDVLILDESEVLQVFDKLNTLE